MQQLFYSVQFLDPTTGNVFLVLHKSISTSCQVITIMIDSTCTIYFDQSRRKYLYTIFYFRSPSPTMHELPFSDSLLRHQMSLLRQSMPSGLQIINRNIKHNPQFL